ncbi:MAG: TraB/GumN family protein [Cyclobacteriaceae bacterium]|nr:TraB/GumN family protein [Cyclobacteriaceae bacterium]
MTYSMKKHLVVAFTALVSFAAVAQDRPSILWEVTGNGLSQPSYLLATIKFVGEKEYFMPPEAVAKMKNCRSFAIEDQVDHHAQHELNKALHFPKGQSLAGAMSAADYQRVVQFFEQEFGIKKAVFEKKYARLKPLALSITMTRLSLGEKVRFYDIELLKLAKSNGLRSYSLESIDREAQALNSFPMADQVKALLHSVDNFETQKAEFRKLMEDYPHGNLEEIFAYTLHPLDNYESFVNEFYFKRNREWEPKLEKMMAENPSFIAVGVSHLEGREGLLELLRAKGYSLTPVPISAR